MNRVELTLTEHLRFHRMKKRIVRAATEGVLGYLTNEPE